MIQDPKITEKLIDILDLAHENGLLTEVIITAMEQALIHGYNRSKETMDQKILDLFEVSAFLEWGL